MAKSELIGTIALVLMVITWIIMSEALQGVQKQFPKPFFMTWFIHAGYGLFLIPPAIMYYLRYRKQEETGIPMEPYPVHGKKLLWFLFAMTFLTCGIAWSWYLSLPETLVAANNAIYQSSSVFVYILSVPVLGEKVTAQKVVAVLVSLTGVALVAFGGSGDSSSTDDFIEPEPIGYFWVLLSTILYAVEQVFYGLYVGGHGGESSSESSSASSDSAVEDDFSGAASPGAGTASAQSLLANQDGNADSAALDVASASADKGRNTSTLVEAEMSMIVLGGFGVGTILFTWPLFFLLNATNVEPFEWPDSQVAATLIENAVLDGIYNILLLFGISMTSPLFISVGTMLVVPGSILADWMIHGDLPSVMTWFGVIGIVLGFVILKLSPAVVRRALASCSGGSSSAVGKGRSDSMSDGEGPVRASVSMASGAHLRESSRVSLNA